MNLCNYALKTEYWRWYWIKNCVAMILVSWSGKDSLKSDFWIWFMQQPGRGSLCSLIVGSKPKLMKNEKKRKKRKKEKEKKKRKWRENNLRWKCKMVIADCPITRHTLYHKDICVVTFQLVISWKATEMLMLMYKIILQL